jgi:RNA recognition motif-containing protein
VKVFRVAEIALENSFSKNWKEIKKDQGDEIFEEKDEGIEFYIGNINYNTSREELYEYLSSFAEVISLSMPPDNFSQRENKGFAFAKFKILGDVNNFISSHKECYFQRRKLVFRRQKK